MKKNYLPALALFLLLGLTALTVPARAAQSGSCGKNGSNLTWTLNYKSLSITGSGEMADYNTTSNPAPWGNSCVKLYIEPGVTSIGEYAFAKCGELDEVVGGGGVKTIGKGAFAWCSKLKTITLPDGLTSIGNNAFESCHNLKEINLPNSIDNIGSWAFSDSGLDGPLTIPQGVSRIQSYSFSNCSGITSASFPLGLTTIETGAFASCGQLSNVSIHQGITSIKGGAFENCKSLKTFIVSELNPNYSVESGVLFDKNKRRLVCYPAGLEKTSYQIPDGVQFIEAFAFKGCESLTSISIPEGVIEIGQYAFHECRSLTEITLPNGLTSIGGYAFYYCNSLTSVTIPASVTSIEYSAFSQCNLLADVYYGGSEQQWAAITIGENNDPLKSAVIHYTNLPIKGLRMDGGTAVITVEPPASGARLAAAFYTASPGLGGRFLGLRMLNVSSAGDYRANSFSRARYVKAILLDSADRPLCAYLSLSI